MLCRLSRWSNDRLLKEILPLAGLIEHGGRIDELERDFVWRLGIQMDRQELPISKDFLSIREKEIVEQQRRMGVGCIAGESFSGGACDGRRQREPIDRGALALALLSQIAVSGKSERYFPRSNEVVDQAVPLAHRDAIRGHDIAEELQPALFAKILDHFGKPIEIVSLDAELPPPLRLHEPVVGFWERVLAHDICVVGLHK